LAALYRFPVDMLRERDWERAASEISRDIEIEVWIETADCVPSRLHMMRREWGRMLSIV